MVRIQRNNSFTASRSKYFYVGAESKTVNRLKQTLHDSRNYLKLDYRTHVSKTSSIADHCLTFGLSDAQNSAWRERCDHEHDEEYI